MKRALIIELGVLIAAVLLLPIFSFAGSATISWNANTDEDLAGYRIYYGTTKGGPYGSSTALVPKAQTGYTITNLSDGTYYFVVTAVDTADNESPYSAEASKTIGAKVSSPVASVTLTSNLSSPQKIGTTVRFTASAAGGSSNYEYKFIKRRKGGTWQVAQDYSSKNTFSWNTTGAAAVNFIAVYARNAGASVEYDTYKWIQYNINIPKVSSVTLASSLSSPQKIGATVAFTATASGGTGIYEYKFLTRRKGGTWQVTQDYSSKNTFSWDSTGAATTNYIAVYARNSGTSVNYDTYKWIEYILK